MGTARKGGEEQSSDTNSSRNMSSGESKHHVGNDVDYSTRTVTVGTDLRIQRRVETLLILDHAVQAQKRRRRFEPQVPHQPGKKTKKASKSPAVMAVACGRSTAAQAARPLPPPTVNRKRHAQVQEQKRLQSIARLLKRERSTIAK